jgi:hypothetical protein
MDNLLAEGRLFEDSKSNKLRVLQSNQTEVEHNYPLANWSIDSNDDASATCRRRSRKFYDFEGGGFGDDILTRKY